MTVTVLPQSRPLTADDIAVLPDDGHRYELIDGTLIVTPAPSWRHQRAVVRLVTALASATVETIQPGGTVTVELSSIPVGAVQLELVNSGDISIVGADI